MSIAVNTDWEVRTTGSPTNGGGFKDLNPGTSVDYSQQDSAQLALTDIASNGAGTGIYSATGGFTAAMEGNVCYISGTGFTTGWYQIVGYTDTNNITIDRSCGASATGGTCNIGGAWDLDATLWTTFFNTTNKSNYNVLHVAAGTYSSLGSSVLTIGASYLRIFGYNSTRNDCPEGTNRPLIDLGNTAAYINWTGGYGRVEFIRIDNTYSSSNLTAMFASGLSFVMRGCKISRSGYSGATAFAPSSTHAKIFQSEFICTGGTALKLANYGMIVQHCWAHDSSYGIMYSGAGSYSSILNHCIVSNCSTTGISLVYGSHVGNCVVYSCGTGVTFSTQTSCSIINTIIQDCTTGLTAAEHCYDDNNILYNNTTQRSGGNVAGPNSLTSNPLLTDPSNDDFTLAATSPAFNAGIKLGSAVGLP